jgi:hypothetical protein
VKKQTELFPQAGEKPVSKRSFEAAADLWLATPIDLLQLGFFEQQQLEKVNTVT